MISSTTSRVAYSGNGVTTSFATTGIPFFNSSELVVTQLVDGVETILTLGVHYTVTGGGTPPVVGTVVFGTAPAVGTLITIHRNTDRRQQSDYVNDAALSPETLESDFDRRAMVTIDQDRDLARALKFPITDDPFVWVPLPPAPERANGQLAFDAFGRPIVATGALDSIPVSVFGATLVQASDFIEALDLLGTERILSGTLAARPAAVVALSGTLYFATNTGQVFRSDGAAWFEIGIAQFGGVSVPAGTGVGGRIILDTSTHELLRDVGGGAGVPLFPVRCLPPNHLSGLGLSYVDADTVAIAGGQARDIADVVNLLNAVSVNKNLANDSSWALGSNQNGMPSVAQGVGRSADTWYGVFAIGGRGVTPDFGFDTSLTAANLLAAAQAVNPLYTRYRRIGWVRTDGGENLIQWTQDGDRFFWNTPQLAYTNTGDFTGAAQTATLTHAPPSAEVFAYLMLGASGATNSIINIVRGGLTAGAPSLNAAPGAAVKDQGGANGVVTVHLHTDTSRNVSFRTANETSLDVMIVVQGWRDPRGRDL